MKRKKLIPVLSFLLFQSSILFSQSGIITTVAGDGVATYGGDRGQATSAGIATPEGLAFDSLGNLYISDFSHNRIRMVNTQGIISTIAGNGVTGFSGDGGPATSAEINGPTGIFVDTAMNIYFADYTNSRIRKISSTGIISTIAGNNTPGYNGDGIKATNAELYEPAGLTIDKYGNILFADEFNSRIRKINTSGIISTIAGDGVDGFFGDGGPATSGEIWGDYGVVIDNTGNIFIGDEDNERIRKINSSGIISTVAGNGLKGYGGDGGPATMAELNCPWFVAVDKVGNLYIADDFNNRIRMVDTSGIISTVVGNGTQGFSGDGGPAINAELYWPSNLLFDNAGNLYICDQYNNRIRKVTGLATGISQPSSFNSKLSVYPNPAQNVIYVQVHGMAKAEMVEIYTITGQKVLTLSRPSPSGEDASVSYSINSSSLSDGVYFLKVLLEDGNIATRKVEIVR